MDLIKNSNVKRVYVGGKSMIKQNFSDDKLQGLVDEIYNKVLSQEQNLIMQIYNFCCTGTVIDTITIKQL